MHRGVQKIYWLIYDIPIIQSYNNVKYNYLKRDWCKQV